MDTARKPAWLRAKLPSGPAYSAVRGLVDSHKLHTVCQSAQCPNLGECWSRGHGDRDDPRQHLHALVQLLRDPDGAPDRARPGRAGPRRRGRRDDGPAGTASSRASPATSLRTGAPRSGRRRSAPCATATPRPRSRSWCRTSRGGSQDVDTVLDARPDIFNHNVETVERLQKPVRVQARYDRSRARPAPREGPRLHGEDRHHARARRARGGDRADAARPGRRRDQHPHHRPVPAADPPAPARRPLGARRRSSGTGRSSGCRSGSGWSRAARWCARATTPTSSRSSTRARSTSTPSNALAGA